MTEEINNQGEPTNEVPPAGAQNADGGQEPAQPQAIPYDRFQEVIAERNKLREEMEAVQKSVEKLKEQQEADRLKKLEEQQSFQELAAEWQGKYKELEPKLAEREAALQAHEAALQSFADAQIDLVPELFRDIVAAMPLLDRIRWMAENQDKLKEQNKKQAIPSTPKGVGASGISEEERRKRAASAW